jgi:catechol 2,3-dioxygenase-like lactoylglutathione lyase family enzyme
MTQAHAVERTGQALAGSRVLFLFVYVDDLPATEAYYEATLGFRRADVASPGTAYDAGEVVLTLVPAAAHGIRLAKPHDDSTDLVFLVDDIAATGAALERRGVRFERRRTYEIGSVRDFYDPNGHRLMLYEPSPHALETPAGDKIRAVWRTHGRGSQRLIGPAAERVEDPDVLAALGFHGKPLVYMFQFIKEIAPSMGFMEGVLGLEAIHRTPCCNSGCPDEQNAVVKYDVGGLLLSTHHMHGHEAVLDDDGNPYAARDFAPEDARGLVPLFEVDDLDLTLAELAARGAPARTVLNDGRFGAVAGVEAPSGHAVYLHGPGSDISA